MNLLYLDTNRESKPPFLNLPITGLLETTLISEEESIDKRAGGKLNNESQT